MIVPGRILPGLLLTLLALGCATSEIPEEDDGVRTRTGAGATSWTADSGWTLAAGGAWGEPGKVRLEALKAFEAGAYADAMGAFSYLVDSPAAARMQDLGYYMGECLYQLGRYEDAIEHLKEGYKADFPSPDLIDKSRRRVFEIALAYMRGRKTKDVLWVFDVTSPEYGIDLLMDPAEGLITENPYLSFADDAYVEVANYYFEQKQYAEQAPGGPQEVQELPAAVSPRRIRGGGEGQAHRDQRDGGGEEPQHRQVLSQGEAPASLRHLPSACSRQVSQYPRGSCRPGNTQQPRE